MEKSLILNLSYGAGYRDGINLFGIKEYNELNNNFKNMCSEICSDMPEEKKYEILIKFQDLQT